MKDQLLQAHAFRFACKVFDHSKSISSEDFNYILETGRLSPSSFGFEPWQFIVLQDKEVREAVKPLAWGAGRQLDTSSHFVLIALKQSEALKAHSEYIRHMAKNVQNLPEEVVEMKLNFFKKFQEDDFDLTDERKLRDWAGKQAYIPLANMMTAAAAIGIDSCPIEGFDFVKTNQLLHDKGVIDQDDYKVAVMVAFGYRDTEQRIGEKTRRSMEDVVKWV